MDKKSLDSNESTKLYHQNNMNNVSPSCFVARSPRLQALLNESRRSITTGKGLSRNEFWKTIKQRYSNPRA